MGGGRTMSYYNTTNLKGKELKDAEKKYLNQESIIHNTFLSVPHHEYTPFEIRDMLSIEWKRYPITSVRRAINRLTEDGILIKTDIMRNGIYGSPNHTWKLKEQDVKGLFLRSMREAL